MAQRQEDNDNRTRIEKESGVGEHDKANYSNADADSKDQGQREDKPSIKETNDEHKKDDTGGDLAGNASGNTDND